MASAVHGGLQPTANSDHLTASLTAQQDQEHHRQQGRTLHHAQKHKTEIKRGSPYSTRPTGGSRLSRCGW